MEAMSLPNVRRATTTLAESPQKSQILTDVPSSCACCGATLTAYENQTRCQCSSALKKKISFARDKEVAKNHIQSRLGTHCLAFDKK